VVVGAMERTGHTVGAAAVRHHRLGDHRVARRPDRRRRRPARRALRRLRRKRRDGL
jgi:hypothetical protein